MDKKPDKFKKEKEVKDSEKIFKNRKSPKKIITRKK